MKTDRFAPGNVVPTAVMPIETAVFAGICDRAPICDGVATTTVWPAAFESPSAPNTQSSRIGASPSGDSLPFTSTVKPAIISVSSTKLLVGMLIVVTASGLPLSSEVVSQEYGHIGSSTIHTSPGLMTMGRSQVMVVAVFAVIFRGGRPRETPLITRTRLPTSAPGVIPAG